MHVTLAPPKFKIISSAGKRQCPRPLLMHPEHLRLFRVTRPVIDVSLRTLHNHLPLEKLKASESSNHLLVNLSPLIASCKEVPSRYDRRGWGVQMLRALPLQSAPVSLRSFFLQMQLSPLTTPCLNKSPKRLGWTQCWMRLVRRTGGY
jgi:hypothetical protein